MTTRERDELGRFKETGELQPWPCQICGKVVQPYYGGHRKKTRRVGKGCCKSHSLKIAYLEGRWHLPNPPNSYGPSNTNWKGGRKLQGGYIYVLAPPDHPVRGLQNGKRRYIAEHRLIMEQHLGRYLEDWEKVHHKNTVKDDNRIENLELVSTKTHRGKVRCPHCHEWFSIR